MYYNIFKDLWINGPSDCFQFLAISITSNVAWLIYIAMPASASISVEHILIRRTARSICSLIL